MINKGNKIDVIVEARMTSSRLPGKVMLEAAGKPMIELMIERLQEITNISDIIIATTINSSDDILESVSRRKGVLCHRGSENDVLGRVLEAANNFSTDIIVEITGDNPLVDPLLVSNMVSEFLLLQDSIDFLSNDVGCYDYSYPIQFPLGLNVKIFKRDLLSVVDKKTSNPVDREHVVNFILNNMDRFRVYEYGATGIYNRPDLRLTMDYKEDYALIKSIFENLYYDNKKFTTKDMINFLDQNPNIKALNKNCMQNKYSYD